MMTVTVTPRGATLLIDKVTVEVTEEAEGNRLWMVIGNAQSVGVTTSPDVRSALIAEPLRLVGQWVVVDVDEDVTAQGKMTDMTVSGITKGTTTAIAGPYREICMIIVGDEEVTTTVFEPDLGHETVGEETIGRTPGVVAKDGEAAEEVADVSSPDQVTGFVMNAARTTSPGESSALSAMWRNEDMAICPPKALQWIVELEIGTALTAILTTSLLV